MLQCPIKLKNKACLYDICMIIMVIGCVDDGTVSNIEDPY